MEFPKLQWLQTTGDISIEPVTGCIPNDPCPVLYLIMGPTGAGKSSFIEALAGESQQLSISKDQLAGYTQTVNTYQVVNVNRYGRPVYLVDTPGFSDSKISEVEIIYMVRKWMRNNDLIYVSAILYLTQISETRLPGSRRRTMAMLKQFLRPGDQLQSVTFVTTMWDTLHNERTQTRAESNFAQLRDQVSKHFFREFTTLFITRFMNTKESALEILDSSNHFSTQSFSRPLLSQSPNLYYDLHDRIEGALLEKQMIDSELAQPEVQTNANLRAILQKNQRENHETLTKFIAQLAYFMPIPKGCEEAHQRLNTSIEAMQCIPPPTFPAEPPALPVVGTASSSNQHARILHGDDGTPATTSPLSVEGQLHIITGFPNNPHAALETDAVLLSAHPDPTPHFSPTSIGQLHLPRMLIMKGLLGRLIQAVKCRGKKWFRKNDD